MASTILPRHSLKNRITLTTLLIFLIGMWSLSFYATLVLRSDMERLLGEQQFSTVTYVAAEINGELEDRIKALESVAAAIDIAMLDNPQTLQSFLDQRFVLNSRFNDGVMAYELAGNAIATTPFQPERIGLNYLDRDYIVGALKNGKTTIGRPVIGKTLGSPVLGVAVPIRDKQGNLIGALSGITNLGKPSFLDKVTQSRYGETGGIYWLIGPTG